MLTFEQGLQAQLDNDPKLRKSAFGRRVTRVLALPESDKRRGRVLARMEMHAKVHLDKFPTANVDWAKVSTIDWQSIIAMLMQLLPLILALFGL